MLANRQDNNNMVQLEHEAIAQYIALNKQISKLKKEKDKYKAILEEGLKTVDIIECEAGKAYYNMWDEVDKAKTLVRLETEYPDIFNQVAVIKGKIRFNCR